MIVQHWCWQQEVSGSDLWYWGREGKSLCAQCTLEEPDQLGEAQEGRLQRETSLQCDKMEERLKWHEGRELMKKMKG